MTITLFPLGNLVQLAIFYNQYNKKNNYFFEGGIKYIYTDSGLKLDATSWIKYNIQNLYLLKVT